MSSFENLRIVDNFYQTSLFFPMPTVIISTLCEDGSTTLGPYSLVQPYYVAGKDFYAMLLSCRNSSNTAQNILRNGKCTLNFIDDNPKSFKEAVKLSWPGDKPSDKMPKCNFRLEKGIIEEETGEKEGRFQRLTAIDEKYVYFQSPAYAENVTLPGVCEDLRNFACANNGLFYELRTIRLMIAGLASTKLVVLQGISGTGKTSLPYVMGKFFLNDATIASVQPSWRDRNELFGYFNEFTKKFNETEVLRRIYEASYNDDVNLIILDEMNIARVEYYFAEMLSVLEMPDPDEWKIELVPSVWEGDPVKLAGGNLKIPQNVWYVGTINNDDSTFSVSDKVYDRAFVINLDSKGVPFEAPATAAQRVSYTDLESLYEKAIEEYPVNEEILDKIAKLDNYVIEKFRIAFGNRIMKQLKRFVPVYVACGGNETEGVDYMLATKVFRKFESLNLSLIRDEIRPLISYMDNLFGKGAMKESITYLQILQKTY